MHCAALTRRLYAVFWLGLAFAVGLLLVTTNTALAHPCEDSYSWAINRANCWWRYASDQSIPEDMSGMSDDMMGSMVDGMVCNSHYTAQQVRENCWWRYHKVCLSLRHSR